jgi:predicted HTH domain antitoxin
MSCAHGSEEKMPSVKIQFTTDIFKALHKPPEEVAFEIRLAAALLWYSRGLISQGKAAEIAELSRSAFIDALAESGLSANQETLDDLDEALARA